MVMGVLRNIISTPCTCNRCQRIWALISVPGVALIFEALHFFPPHRRKMSGYKMQGAAIWQKNEVCHMRFNTCHISQDMLVSQPDVTAFACNTKGQTCLEVISLPTSHAGSRERMNFFFLFFSTFLYSLYRECKVKWI